MSKRSDEGSQLSTVKDQSDSSIMGPVVVILGAVVFKDNGVSAKATMIDWFPAIWKKIVVVLSLWLKLLIGVWSPVHASKR